MTMDLRPIEIEPIQPLRRWWVPIVFAIAVLAIANTVLVAIGVSHTPRHEERLLEAKWALAGDTRRTFDWVVLGDSSATLGVAPETLSRELGGEAINLGTFGAMGLTGDVWMLDRYLAHHEPPRGVIVVHAAEVWAGHRDDAFFQYAAAIPISTPALFRRLIELRSRPSEMFITARYRDWFPLLTIKDHVRGGVDRSIDQPIGGGDSGGEANSVELKMPADGTWRMTADQARPESVIASSRIYMSDVVEPAKMDPRYLVALEELVLRSRRDGFEIYFSGGPLPRLVRESTTFDGKVRGVTTELTKLSDRETQVHFVLRDWVSFEPDVMENCNHVVGPAIDEYTTQLARAIRDSMDSR